MAIVNMLIEYGADLGLCDSDGQTALHKVRHFTINKLVKFTKLMLQ